MKVYHSKVLENRLISTNIYKMTIEIDNLNNDIKPGQFFMLKTLDNSFLLPRPISVNEVGVNTVTFVYRIQGTGTKSISYVKLKDYIQATGPLGNGFDINLINGRVAIIGGGIGIAPLLYLTKCLKTTSDVYLGYKDEVYLVDEFRRYANKTVVVTENGGIGFKGFVTDYVDYNNYDIVITCGPEIMMNKIASKCRDLNIKCLVSLERRMACGLGACLGCTVETIYGNKRACKDGPIFAGEEILVQWRK
ncbi:MAG: dihydroorotate dehydrogenase electron transfer subunit [Tissierellia bacterium]|nr:dihydroorotate dehydrogenase electron transfer subunit [Tissierellia bacterium]MDD4780007.1 dihydroorotate dehydrogenase electron transfer subunit [Tissierellia bacterium]